MSLFSNSLRDKTSSFFISPIMPFWAVVMGALGALSTQIFYSVMLWTDKLFTHQPASISNIASNFTPFQCLVLPMLGGLVGGILLNFANRFHTTAKSDYMEAVALGDGRLSLPQGLLRVLSSLSTITTGGSIGREGPLIHLAALLSSTLGRAFFADVVRLRILVACGAAAGLSAAYNAPIAGAVFVAEIVVGSLNMAVIGLLLIASGTAHFVMLYSGKYNILYESLENWNFGAPEVAWATLIGVLAGVGAPAVLALIACARKLFQKIPWSLPARMALGGLLMGVLLMFDRDLAGNGAHIIQSLIFSDWAWKTLLLFMIMKILATTLTVGSGAVGGVITPIMLVGAATGLLVTEAAQPFLHSLDDLEVGFALVGMGSFLSAATSAPIMAIIMVVEMTNNLSLAPTLIFSCNAAYLVSRRLNGQVMYGVTQTRAYSESLRRQLRHLHTEDFIRKPHNVIYYQSSLRKAIVKFTQFSVRYLYVVNARGEYLGVLAHRDITRLMLDDINPDRPIPPELISDSYLEPLTTGMTLDELQKCMVNFSGERLPVVDHAQPPYLLGVVHKSEVLAKYSEIKQSLDQSSEVTMDLQA